MQRPVGSVGVEALLDHASRSFDKYCGVMACVTAVSTFEGVAVPAHARVEGSFSPNQATPQKSFGLREATIHARRK